jgi:hypothetical protein
VSDMVDMVDTKQRVVERAVVGTLESGVARKVWFLIKIQCENGAAFYSGKNSKSTGRIYGVKMIDLENGELQFGGQRW